MPNDMATNEIDDTEVNRIRLMHSEGGPLTDDEAAVIAVLEPEKQKSTEFLANLAEDIEDSELQKIGKDVVQWYEWDDESRADWKRREAKGMLMLGVTEKVEGGAKFDGASKVVHPLLMEACVQFQSKAISEIWPAEGPVKGRILGDVTPELQDQSDRAVGYMNYQYTVEMPGAFETEDNLLFRLPLSGSCFTKIYRDPLTGLLIREFVDPNYFVCPYGATSLRTAPRYTHVFYEGENTVKKKQVKGFYRDVVLSAPYEDADSGTTTQEVRDTIDDAEGRDQVNITEDQRHTMLEMHLDLDLVGYEDKEGGKVTGIALPYVVTVERGSYKVLSIYRNWREDDEKKEKRIHFTHRRFLPGLGFYGFGFLHAIGGLARAATGALRSLLDAASFANMQGGLRSKDAKLPSGNATVGPGEWLEVESTAEELKNAFLPLPYKEPSMAIFNLLGGLDDLGRRFASTTEVMTGEASNQAPVGTTVALIEQGMKLFSSIHKRQYAALSEEFSLVAELNSEALPGGEEEYPYNVPGESRTVKLTDFDDRVDVIPVSDPNIVSTAQRIAQAQGVLQLSSDAPDLYNRSEAHKRMLQAMRVEDIDQVLIDKSAGHRMGPVEENISMMSGMPVKAYLEQDHIAHMTVHESWFMGLPPDSQQMQQQSHMAHKAEHMAQTYLLNIQQQVGQRLPAIEIFSADYEEGAEGKELPIELENDIALMVSQAIQEQQQQAAQNQPPDPDTVEMQAEQARKDEIAQREQGRKDSVTAQDQDRKDKEFVAEQTRKDDELDAEILRAGEKQAVELNAIERSAEVKEAVELRKVNKETGGK